jgi:hypothetical protein
MLPWFDEAPQAGGVTRGLRVSGVSSYSLYATHCRASKSLLSTRESSGYVQTKLTQTRVRLDSRIYDLNVDRKR